MLDKQHVSDLDIKPAHSTTVTALVYRVTALESATTALENAIKAHNAKADNRCSALKRVGACSSPDDKLRCIHCPRLMRIEAAQSEPGEPSESTVRLGDG